MDALLCRLDMLRSFGVVVVVVIVVVGWSCRVVLRKRRLDVKCARLGAYADIEALILAVQEHCTRSG